MKKWKNHFQSVLNREAPSIHANIPENDINLDVDTNPPSLDEVKNAITAVGTLNQEKHQALMVYMLRC